MGTAPAMTTTALAQEFDTTPRDLRKFLRSPESGIESVGKGSRYALPGTKTGITALKKKFDAWSAAAVQVKSEKTEEVDEMIDETDIEPTDEDLEDEDWIDED